MTEAEDKILSSHLSCATCGKVATREEHRELMVVLKMTGRPPVYRVWFGWEIDARDGREIIQCPECAA